MADRRPHAQHLARQKDGPLISSLAVGVDSFLALGFVIRSFVALYSDEWCFRALGGERSAGRG